MLAFLAPYSAEFLLSFRFADPGESSTRFASELGLLSYLLVSQEKAKDVVYLACNLSNIAYYCSVNSSLGGY